MIRIVAVLLLAGVLVSCAGGDDPPPATSGAAALGARLSTMDEVVEFVRDVAGDCSDVRPRSVADLRTFVGSSTASLFEPYVSEWATCSVSSRFPRTGLLLFTGDGQREFQESWRSAMESGRVSDGPTFAFGNGFAVSAGFLGVSELGLYYFRCDYSDPQVHQVPADVAGCMFANPEHGHH